MKQLLFCLVFAALCCGNTLNAQNCAFLSNTVFIESTEQLPNGSCVIKFQMAFDVRVNPGEKNIYVHLWKNSDYPGIDYTSNNAPTAASGLANTVLNFGINNFGPTPVFIPAYPADNSVILQNTVNNPELTIEKTNSTTPGADRFIIKHLKVTMPNSVCGGSLLFKGDVWSTNSGNGTVVHCAIINIAVGLIDPMVTGICEDLANPHTYNFTISSLAASTQVYYDCYLDDNGNNLFEPANDLLLTSLLPDDAITITTTSPFVSPQLSYPSNPASSTKKVFVIVKVVNQGYSIGTEITPCPTFLPITLRNFNASPTKGGATLTWTTETEQNNAGFEIQRTDRDQGNFESIGNVPSKASGGNSSVALDYSFTDFINTQSKSFYYRLKQIDSDGNHSYSAIKKVSFTGSDRLFMLLPNPVVNGKANIIISQALGKIDLEVRNVQGALVKSISNSNEKNIQLYDLKPGIYFIRLTDKLNNTTHTEKLIVQ